MLLLNRSCASETQHRLFGKSFVESLCVRHAAKWSSKRQVSLPVESHLASNVHKSRLVQQDLQVAKRLQEEEDKRAKAESKRQYRHMWVNWNPHHKTSERPGHLKIKLYSSCLERKVILFSNLPKLVAVSDAAEPVGKSCSFCCLLR